MKKNTTTRRAMVVLGADLADDIEKKRAELERARCRKPSVSAVLAEAAARGLSAVGQALEPSGAAR
jgi:hypothetical protein